MAKVYKCHIEPKALLENSQKYDKWFFQENFSHLQGIKIAKTTSETMAIQKISFFENFPLQFSAQKSSKFGLTILLLFVSKLIDNFTLWQKYSNLSGLNNNLIKVKSYGWDLCRVKEYVLLGGLECMLL